MEQIGCVLVFKPGADPNEIIRRLKALEGVVDVNYATSPAEFVRYNPNKIGKTKHLVTTKDGQKTIASLHKFTPDTGGPVWYIP